MQRIRNQVVRWSAVGFAFLLALLAGYRCSSGEKVSRQTSIQTIQTNANGKGLAITLEFISGASHNHPLMAVWLEDTAGRYLETLYIAESIGKGVFQHGDRSDGIWQAGPVRRPAALPYWGHKMGYQAPDGYFLPTPEHPMPDAVTGATPAGNFILDSRTSAPIQGPFVVLMEINQPWDWNDYWTNSKFPGDDQYMTSSQPSVVYAATVDPSSGTKEYTLKAIGHGHYSGEDGKLYSDLSTLTTALDIVKSAKVMILDPAMH